MEHRTLTANGLRFHVAVEGEGPLVILLHGFPQSWYGWRHQIPALAERFRVAAPDMRGYGKSDKPPRARDYRVENLVADVVGIADALGEEEFHLVGHDWGGVVGWAAALAHPDRVRTYAALNIPEPRHFGDQLFRNFAQLRKSWYIFFFQIPWLPERLFLWNDRQLVTKTFRDWSIRKDAFTDEDLEVFRQAWNEPGAMRSMIHYYRAAFRDGARRGAGRDRRPVRVPTLVIWGELDQALGKELTRGMEKWVDAPYRIEYVPNTSHWVNEERPELVNRLLLEHFTGDPGAGE